MTGSASIKNPQTFNRYSYVLNSPYKFSDPLGLIPSTTGACGSGCPWTAGGSMGLIGLYSSNGESIEIRPGQQQAEPPASQQQAMPPDDIPEEAMCNPKHPFWESYMSQGSSSAANPRPQIGATLNIGWQPTGILIEASDGNDFRGEGIEFSFNVYVNNTATEVDDLTYNILRLDDDGDLRPFSSGNGKGRVKITSIATNGAWDSIDGERWDASQRMPVVTSEAYIIRVQTNGSVATFGVSLTATHDADDQLFGTIRVLSSEIRITSTRPGRVVINAIRP